jgi:uncharacterized glyoxalase superfamily protein PhnB
MLGELKPFIPSGPDFARSKQFFVDLGFTVDWEAPGLAQLRLGGAAFLLQDYNNKEMQENLMMYVTVADLDEWWRRIQDSGVLGKYEGVRAKEPTVFPWGKREVHLIDPAGVCWHFA